jgi:hypothetical protein
VPLDREHVEGDWHTAFGVTPRGAVLVRPDGYVAWRTQDTAEVPTLTPVLARLLAR